MATGPEHWRKAEALLIRAESPSVRRLTTEAHRLLARAQVHATLAAAAATIELAQVIDSGENGIRPDWIEVTST